MNHLTRYVMLVFVLTVLRLGGDQFLCEMLGWIRIFWRQKDTVFCVLLHNY